MDRNGWRFGRVSVFLAAVALASITCRAGASDDARHTDRYGEPLPDGAVARLGTHRLRHTRPISAVAFSPDCKILASAGDDSAISLWELPSGRLLRTFHAMLASKLAFSPDGNTLFALMYGVDWHGGSPAEDELQLWDVKTAKLLRQTIHQTSGTPWSSPEALSPDATFLISMNETVHVFDTRTGKERPSALNAIRVGDLAGFALSSDGRTLAVANQQDGIRFIDTGNGREIGRLNAPSEWETRLSFSYDGRLLATSSGGQICIWDWRKRTVRRSLRPGGATAFLQFTPDGKSLFSGSDDRLSSWDVASGKEIHRFAGERREAKTLVLSPDGKLLAGAEWDETVRIWDVASGARAFDFDAHSDSVNTVAFSPDGKNLASGSCDRTCIWDIDQAAAPRRLGAKGAYQVAYGENGTLLACVDCWVGPRLYRAADGKELHRLQKLPEQAREVAFAGDGVTLVAKNAVTGFLCVWNSTTGKLLAEFLVDDLKAHGWRPSDGFGGKGPQGVLGVAPDGRRVVLGGINTLTEVWSLPDGKCLGRLGEEIRCDLFGAFSPDGKAFATGGNEGIHLWDVATLKKRSTLRDSDEIVALAFSPDGRSMAAADRSGAVSLWELASGMKRRQWDRVLGESHPVRSLAISPNGRLLATGREDSTILIWDITHATSKRAKDHKTATENVLESCWIDLSSPDAVRAYEAMCLFMGNPRRGVAFLAEQMRPITTPDANKTARLVRDLGSARFQDREKASGELESLGKAVESDLRQAENGPVAPEVRGRVERLLQKLSGPKPPSALREVRAIEVLERVDTPESRDLLKRLANGASRAPRTEEAKQALDRLARADRMRRDVPPR